MFRANRHRPSEQHREQVLDLLPNAAVVYALMQHVEETFEYLRSEDRLSLPSGNVMVALASVGQLLGLVEADIERLLNFAEKEPSFVLTGMSFSEFVDAVRCLAVLHGHLALEALPVLQGKCCVGASLHRTRHGRCPPQTGTRPLPMRMEQRHHLCPRRVSCATTALLPNQALASAASCLLLTYVDPPLKRTLACQPGTRETDHTCSPSLPL
ncbi:hypothetical protein Vretifemale_3176 [Volvox reticuliferus]|uniref:Uncharacterized protein n=1 Tax=Volvox reticuliferus TaxID=1737510 RepID=A0A8J4FI11_9CHLO|nr:hypothetical protein Vretifemale_3176 [Volvox reticuliferus]